MTLEMVVEIRRVDGGWEVANFRAISNRVTRIDQNAYEAEAEESAAASEAEAAASYVDDEDCGDGSSGASSNCGETLMEGYHLFNRD